MAHLSRASGQGQDADRAVERLGELYVGLDPTRPESIEAFLAGVDAARALTGGPADPNRALVELLHARGLLTLTRDEAAESVLRSAIETTSGDSRPRAFLHLDLAEACSRRSESASVLDLTARAEAMCASVPGLAADLGFRLALLLPRCQAWIALGRPDRMADLAVQLAQLAPSLDPEFRRYVALQRGNALLGLRA
jgi:hypothetical protein